eukprot:Filipodium_phascolosomae@DN5169_c0_g1_i1.p1
MLGHVFARLLTTEEGRAAVLAQGNETLKAFTEQMKYKTRVPSLIDFFRNLLIDRSTQTIINLQNTLLIPYLCFFVLPPLCQSDPQVEIRIEDLSEVLQKHKIDDTSGLTASPIQFSEDTRLRKTICDVFELLCGSIAGRSELRKHKVYEVLRVWHTLEKEDEIRDQIDHVVQFVARTEDELSNDTDTTNV